MVDCPSHRAKVPPGDGEATFHARDAAWVPRSLDQARSLVEMSFEEAERPDPKKRRIRFRQPQAAPT
jgi:hypothetical protein